jgi:hypothetical protein
MTKYEILGITIASIGLIVPILIGIFAKPLARWGNDLWKRIYSKKKAIISISLIIVVAGLVIYVVSLKIDQPVIDQPDPPIIETKSTETKEEGDKPDPPILADSAPIPIPSPPAMSKELYQLYEKGTPLENALQEIHANNLGGYINEENVDNLIQELTPILDDINNLLKNENNKEVSEWSDKTQILIQEVKKQYEINEN